MLMTSLARDADVLGRIKVEIEVEVEEVWELTTEVERLFHCGIVWVKKEFFRKSLYVWYLQHWALCDDLVVFKL